MLFFLCEMYIFITYTTDIYIILFLYKSCTETYAAGLCVPYSDNTGYKAVAMGKGKIEPVDKTIKVLSAISKWLNAENHY